ncbi:MAG TPA: PTS system mannose/fructose/sorbose family transporter subunit IID [Anaerolineae bacterium]|nr:PTS system mannose/fructose/sorbose family transporter subunit IID [Anaerolineae bacterium]
MGNDDNKSSNLTLITFLQVYLRSFFSQGSFSTKYRQNMGFAFCIEPVGRKLWEDPESRRIFLLRHMEDYNGNPFMIPLVLGAVAKLEEMLRYKKGITESDIAQFKKAVGPATGSVGDRFIWGTLRPFAIVLGIFTALFHGVWGSLVFLAVFNIPLFVLKWHWLMTGYRLGTDIVIEIRNQRINTVVKVMESLGASLIAFIATITILVPESTLSLVSGVTVGFFVLSIFIIKRYLNLSVAFLMSLGFSVVLGIVMSLVSL